jgi:hypothetical protein
VKLFLKVVLAVGALVVIAIVVALVSPQGRAVLGIVRTLVTAARSPTAQELVRHGCATALVTPLGGIVEALGRIVDLKEDERAALIVAENPTLVFCAADSGKPTPDCAALARAYGSLDTTAPPQFGVLVQAGDATACAGYFAPDGTRLADFAAGQPPVEEQPAAGPE